MERPSADAMVIREHVQPLKPHVMKSKPLFVMLFVLSVTVSPAWFSPSGAGGQSASGLPPFTGEVTFLYFNDLDRAATFYGETLGLEKTFDAGWVRIFAISPSSSVALVDGAKGAHRPSNDKPVTVAMVVSDLKDVDRWYDYLKTRAVSIHMPPFDAPSVNVREFRFTDPEGYTLEIFAWLKK